jgi:hypothetical protein
MARSHILYSLTVVSPGCTVYLDLGALFLAVEPTTDAFGGIGLRTGGPTQESPEASARARRVRVRGRLGDPLVVIPMSARVVWATRGTVTFMGKPITKTPPRKLAEPAKAPTRLVQASPETATKPMGKKTGAPKSPETKVIKVQTTGVTPKRPATAAAATKTPATTRQLAKR